MAIFSEEVYPYIGHVDGKMATVLSEIIRH